MTKFLIGAGGWAYFQIPRLDPLEAYARAFNFVEVNSTFYKIPSFQLVESWRRRVPSDFEFAVRCNRNITHKHKLEPTDEAFETFEVMKDICRILNSKFLVLQTPSSSVFNNSKIKSVRDFFESIDLNGIMIVWEVRRKRGEPIPSSVVALMQDYNIIYCTDLSKEEPKTQSDTVYTRVFGKGRHNIYQFTDKEIVEIDNKITRRDPDTVVVSYHNVRMYKDAARHRIYKKTRRFPSITGVEGQLSLRKVLMEDAKFPTSKKALLNSQGWKVIDLTRDIRVHASALLDKLPDKQYRNIEEVLQCTAKIME